MSSNQINPSGTITNPPPPPPSPPKNSGNFGIGGILWFICSCICCFIFPFICLILIIRGLMPRKTQTIVQQVPYGQPMQGVPMMAPAPTQ